jgi:hypothetical protein
MLKRKNILAKPAHPTLMLLPREAETFDLLVNFENDDSGLAVKMLFR